MNSENQVRQGLRASSPPVAGVPARRLRFAQIAVGQDARPQVGWKPAILGVTVFAVLMAAGAVAQTAATDTQTTAPPPVRDSALVKASKKAGTAPKMPKKVITNKDVKKSKGKLAVATPPPIPAVPATATPADTRTPSQVSDENYRDRKAANERAKVAEKRVDELQKDLAAIEQAYYAEKDLNLRDDAIQKRFAQTKRQLEAARKELADARDATAPAIPKP